jgi:hypothetical protein
VTSDAELTWLVREWLHDGPTELPDRVLSTVLAQVPATPRRDSPLRRLAWRPLSALDPKRAAVAVLVVGLGMLGLAGLSGRFSGPDAAHVAPSPSVRPTFGPSPHPAPTPEIPVPPTPALTERIGPAFATSPVPGARIGELTLIPHPASPKWLTFIAGQPIDGHLRTDDALSSPGVPITLRLYRVDPAEGLLMTWAAGYKVGAGQTDLDVQIDGQEPGSYRLVAYHAMTEPLAVLDLTVEGDASTLPVRPSVPPDWHAARSMSGDLELWLPPDFGAVADRSSLLANASPRQGATEWISVLAESPTGVDLPPAPGTSLATWLDDRWFATDGGEWSLGVTSAVRLPAGEAVQLVRHLELQSGTRTAILLAIRSTEGVGFLLIDGPIDQIGDRSDDLELIPKLVAYP